MMNVLRVRDAANVIITVFGLIRSGIETSMLATKWIRQFKLYTSNQDKSKFSLCEQYVSVLVAPEL